MRWVMLAFSVFLLFMGGMAYAKLKLDTQISDVRKAAGGICAGGEVEAPDEEELVARVQRVGATHAVELSEVSVAVGELDTEKDTGVGVEVQKKLEVIPGLQVSTTVARIHAHASVKKWLWSREEDIDTTCTLSRDVQRVLTPGQEAEIGQGSADMPGQRGEQVRSRAGQILDQQ